MYKSKMIFPSQKRGNVIEGRQPKGVQPKIRDRKLRIGVNW